MRHRKKTYIRETEDSFSIATATSIKKVVNDSLWYKDGWQRDKKEKTSYKHSNKSYKGYEKPVGVNTSPQQQSFLSKLIGKIKRWFKW